MDSSLLIDGLNLLDSLPILLAETSFLAKLGNVIWLGLQVAMGLGFVIFVHELGHFLAAKTFGVRCDKFYVGFDVPISIGPIKLPRTLGKFQWGETEYGIGIIPLGGYVKMLGQDDDPRRAEEEAAKIRENGGEDAPLDPRSYPAKPVWQRMIIISAGVVMNLIFAVLLAGVAYRMGVSYTPTVAGSTYGGSPAWQAGIETSDQVVRVAKMKEDFEDMRYGDFAPAIAMYGIENPGEAIPMAVIRDGQRIELGIVPTKKYNAKGFDSIGYSFATIPKIAAPQYRETSFLAASFLANKRPEVQPGDTVTAVNGEELPVDDRFGVVLGSELTARLQANWEQPVTITVTRSTEDDKQTPETATIELPPVPVNSMGLGFEVGPVTAIRDNSIAANSGIKVGDVIETVNGQAVTNALELPSMVAHHAGQTVRIDVRRKVVAGAAAAEEETVEITFPTTPEPSFDPIAPRFGELTLGGIGVAFAVSPTIRHVVEAPTDTGGGFEVGDVLKQVQWVPEESMQEVLDKQFEPLAFEKRGIDDTFNIACFYSLLQQMPVDSKLLCTVERDGKIIAPIALKTKYADDWYWHQRGISLSRLLQTHQTDSIATAAGLGLWETSRRFKEVLGFLKLLVTGKIGAKAVGGPIMIAKAAASEASMGVPRLMIFLTFLSANLAILNFLPIPALDGGHMVFLTCEAMMGKPVPESLQMKLTMVGVLGLLSLMAFVIVKDIMWIAG